MEQLTNLKAAELISITLSTGKIIGSFYCYDPESQSIMVQNGESQLIWISGRNNIINIQSINELENAQESKINSVESWLMNKIESESQELLKNEGVNLSLSHKTLQIQLKLMEFLGEHQLSPELDQKTKKIKVGSSLFILPPYDANCCRSSNEIRKRVTVMICLERG